MEVTLGNDSAVERVTNADGTVTTTHVTGALETHAVFPIDWSVGQAFVAVSDPRGIWAAHAADSTLPTWVESDSTTLANLLADHFKCPVGRPAPATTTP